MMMLEQPAYLVMLLIISLWGGSEELSLEPGTYAGQMVIVTDGDEPGEQHAIEFTINESGELAAFETRSATLERQVAVDEQGWQITERTRANADEDFGSPDEDNTGVAPHRMTFERETLGDMVRLADPHAEGRHVYVRPNLIVIEIEPDARRGDDEPLLTTITFWPVETEPDSR